MADAEVGKIGAVSRRKPSRLQRRAPSSLSVNRSCEWNVAIPLLSPTMEELPPAVASTGGSPPQDPPQQQRRIPPENVVFKKWQHPAAPFCYDPPPSTVVTPFVPVEL